MAATEERIAALRLDLNPRQRAFAELILKEYTATEAYKEVYDTDPQHPITHRTCCECGSRLLGHPKVRAYVEAVSSAAIDEIIMNRAEVLAGLRDVAMSGIKQGPGAGARVQALKILLDVLSGGEKRTIVHTGPDGKPIQSEVTQKGGLSDDTVDALKRVLFGAYGATDEKA